MKKTRALVAALAILAAVIGLVLTLAGGDDSTPPGQTLTAIAPKPKPLGVPPAPASELREDLSSDSVPELSTKQEAQRHRFNQTLPGPRPSATGFQAPPPPKGCSYYLRGSNFGSRDGSPILLGVAHRVVAPNRPGKGDILGTADYLARAGVRASTTAIVDFEANCIITVQKAFSPWTQIGWNRVGCSVENQGNPKDPISAGQYRMNARVFRWCGIPARKASVAGSGKVLRSGVTDHQALPFNSHYDIRCAPPGGGQKPGCSYYVVDPIIRAMRGESVAPSPLVKAERTTVNRRCYHFRERFKARRGSALERKHYRWSLHWKAAAGARKTMLTKLDHYKLRHRGVRRQAMARTEAFTPAYRRQLCR